jgi:hypothetical protein
LGTFEEDQAAWRESASELAEWSEANTVNRSDAWGGYNPLAIRGEVNSRTGGTFGSNYSVTPQAGRGLTREILEQHFRGDKPEHVVGTYAIGLDDTCKGILLDFDSHGSEDDAETAERNERFALSIGSRLTQLGLTWLLSDSNGKGGFHLRVLFDPPIPASLAERFGEWLVQDWQHAGFTQRPETFPKAATHKTTSGKNLGGGWCRVIGRHHTREVYATVWNGSQFVAGEAAIECILATVGNDPILIPEDARSYRTERETKAAAALLEQQRAAELSRNTPRYSGSVNPMDVAREYCEQYPGSVSGQESEKHLLKLIKWLILACCLNVNQCVSVVADHWNYKCVDANGAPWPFTLAELQHKAEDSYRVNAHNAHGNALAWAEAKASGDYSKVRPAMPSDATEEDAFEAIRDRTPEPDPRPIVSIESIRTEIQATRESILNKPGIYVDRAGVGSGKSYADRQLALKAFRSGKKTAILVPSNTLAADELKAFGNDPEMDGLTVVQILPRTTQNRADKLKNGAVVNCWNDDADIAESTGLPSSTVCEYCRERARCFGSGYMANKVAAKTSDVLIATTQRAALVGFGKLCENRDVILSHEAAVDQLAPTSGWAWHSVLEIQKLVSRLLADPAQSEEYFDKEGISIRSLAQRQEQRQLLEALLSFVNWLVKQTENLTESTEIERTWTCRNVPGQFWPIWRDLRPDWWGDGMPKGVVNSGALSGLLGYLQKSDSVNPKMYCQVDSARPNGKESQSIKSFTFTWENIPPSGSVTVFSDGTAEFEQLEAITGKRITDITPNGRAPTFHRIVQIASDINSQTSPKVVSNIVRGVLAADTAKQRFGIICLQKHTKELESLKNETGRISNISYFWSGNDTGSNRWVGEWNCDSLIIAGTPRPNQAAIRRRLYQTNNPAARLTSDNAGWSEYTWRGQCENGTEVELRTKGYINDAWHNAYKSLAWATIQQAIGRGRITLVDRGIPVYVISKEPLGLPIIDNQVLPVLTKHHSQILDAVRDATARGEGLRMKDLAKLTRLQDCQTRCLSRDLEIWGFISRASQRSGWKATQTESMTKPISIPIGSAIDSQASIVSLKVPSLSEIDLQLSGAQETVKPTEEAEIDLSGFLDVFEVGNKPSRSMRSEAGQVDASGPLSA